VSKRTGDDHARLASILVFESHRLVERAAHDATTLLSDSDALAARLPARSLQWQGTTFAQPGFHLAYPPDSTSQLTEAEVCALRELHLPSEAQSAVRKIIQAETATAFAEFFAMLDAVGDPVVAKVADWRAVDFASREGDDSRAMLHDEFFDSYANYRRIRDEADASPPDDNKRR
jgi:hypothetical protein